MALGASGARIDQWSAQRYTSLVHIFPGLDIVESIQCEVKSTNEIVAVLVFGVWGYLISGPLGLGLGLGSPGHILSVAHVTLI